VSLWLRSLLLCDDVRFELGGTVSLVGVYADHIVVGIEGEADMIELRQLAIHCVIAGLRDCKKLEWRQILLGEDVEPAVLGEGTDAHDPTEDEHRLVNLLAPFQVPGPGTYRIVVELESGRERRSIEHRFTVEKLTPEAAAAAL
jgi:hypothetical protein